MRKCLLATALLAALNAVAAENGVPPQLSDLESRLRRLEADHAALQAQAAATLAALQQARVEIDALKTAPTAAAEASAPPISVATESASTAANAFNPAISVILDGRYAHHSLAEDDYQRPGFPIVGEAGPGAAGLSLGESEVSFAANVDDKFFAQFTLAAGSDDGEDEIAIEESYIETTALPHGFSARAGRFFSNIGYLNTHHAHTDAFVDRPLAYQAFLGNQFGDDGIQLRWVAPTDTYVEVSAEALRGNSFPSGGSAHDGAGAHTLAVHAGGDVGVEHSWLAGVSMLRADTEGGEDGFSGETELYVADLTWKWAPNGNSKDAGITVRGEYIRDDRRGVWSNPADAEVIDDWNGTRRGGYLEGVWRIDRRFDAGYRYDRLESDAGLADATSHDPVRHNLMLTWHNSDFSLLRLQYSHDRANAEATDDALLLQYQAAFGAHGAHKF